jgi:hypothetical protein
VQICGLDTVPAFGAGVRPSKSIRGYSTSGNWQKLETVRWLVILQVARKHAPTDRNDRTLNHPAEKADLEARPHAALAVDGDIPALGVKDGFGKRQPDADAVLARVRAAVKAVEDVR